MVDRCIIILWRFKDTNHLERENEIFFKLANVTTTNDKIVFIEYSGGENINLINYELFISKFLNYYKCIVLYHNKPKSKIHEWKGLFEKMGIKSQYFGDGYGIVYDKIIANDRINKDAFDRELLKHEVFDEVWEFYTKREDLRNISKEIIKIFLPISIDLKGLTLKNNNNIRDNYLSEILRSHKLQDKSINYHYYKNAYLDFINLIGISKFDKDFNKIGPSYDNLSLQLIDRKKFSKNFEDFDVGLSDTVTFRINRIKKESPIFKFFEKMDQMASELDHNKKKFSNEFFKDYITNKDKFDFCYWFNNLINKMRSLYGYKKNT